MSDIISLKTIPAPGGHPDVKADARRVFDVLQVVASRLCRPRWIIRLWPLRPKPSSGRFLPHSGGPATPRASLGTVALYRKLQILPEKTLEMIRVLNQDMDMLFGIVAPYRANHPALQHLTPAMLANATKYGTLGIYVGCSALLLELGRLNDESGQTGV